MTVSELPAASKACALFVVDDDDVLRNTLVELFSLDGYQARGFGTAEQLLHSCALAAIGGSEVFCVVTDVKMPGVGGISLLQQLIHRGNAAIVLMSGASTPADVIAAFECGATEFLLKPIEMPKLFATVKKVLARARQGDSSASPRIAQYPSAEALSDQERELIWREFNGMPA